MAIDTVNSKFFAQCFFAYGKVEMKHFNSEFEVFLWAKSFVGKVAAKLVLLPIGNDGCIRDDGVLYEAQNLRWVRIG